MKFSRASLLELVMLIERDYSYQDAADRVNCARKSLYNWLSESKANVDQGAASPYFIVERQAHFHDLMAAARKVDPRKLPPMPLDSEEEFAERARIDDEVEELIEDATVERSLVVSADELRTDIQELRAFAREWLARPKRAGTAQIWGRPNPLDPPERITGPRPEPPPKSVAQREREHPRAAPQGWTGPPLHKPDPPKPAWAKPINTASIGAQTTLPEEGRFNAVPTKSYSLAERRAGTVSLSENGIKRW